MEDMFLKKILLQSLITLKLRDRISSKTQNINNDQGFTLIELLVVIIIIGLLAAIALPSFLGQTQKARFSEAKLYVGTMSRNQQAYYLEKGVFATDLSSLGMGGANSAAYSYEIRTGSVTGTATPVQSNLIISNVAVPKEEAFRAFVGVVALSATPSNEPKIDTIFCTADLLGAGQAAIARGTNISSTSIQCPPNFFTRE